MKKNILNPLLEAMDLKKVNEHTEVLIIKITAYAQELNIKLDRGNIFSFQQSYGLISKKRNNYKTLTLKNLMSCKKNVEDYYNETKKINVRETYKKIQRWVKVLELYIEKENDLIIKESKLPSSDIELSVFSLIDRKKTTISFQEAYNDYRTVYCIPSDAKVDIDKFIKYLDLNYLKLDEKSFFKFLGASR